MRQTAGDLHDLIEPRHSSRLVVRCAVVPLLAQHTGREQTLERDGLCLHKLGPTIGAAK